jgi:hypothetical protein
LVQTKGSEEDAVGDRDFKIGLLEGPVVGLFGFEVIALNGFELAGLLEGAAVDIVGLAGLVEVGLLDGAAEGFVGLPVDGRLLGGRELLIYDTV